VETTGPIEYMGSNIDKDIINYEGSVDDAVHTTNYNEQN
jgi:hypothetical protein